MFSLHSNSTLNLVSKVTGNNQLSEGVYSQSWVPIGYIAHLKAHLAAMYYTQIYGHGYSYTFFL